MSPAFNTVETHRIKAGCCEFTLDTIAMIKRRLERDVIFIRSNNEGSFGNVFKTKHGNHSLRKRSAHTSLERTRQTQGQDSNNQGQGSPEFLTICGLRLFILPATLQTGPLWRSTPRRLPLR